MIILELDLKINIRTNEKIQNKIKLLEEDLKLKEKEINFYKEQKKYLDENANEELFKIFENEINNIRNLLKEKTLEFLKMENKYKKNYEEYSINYSKFKENLDLLKDENSKYFEGLKKISTNLEKRNFNKLTEIISNINLKENIANILKIQDQEKLTEEKNYSNGNLDDKKKNVLNKVSNSIQDDLNCLNSDESFNREECIENKKEKNFANQVLDEFDKLFSKELNRIEKHYKKSHITSESLNMKRTSLSPKRSSLDKNYIEWKRKSANDYFLQTLRTSSKDNNKTLNNSKGLVTNNSISLDGIDSQLNTYGDINSCVNQAKERVRKSILSGEQNMCDNIKTLANSTYVENLKKKASYSPIKRFNERDNFMDKSDLLNNSKLSQNQNGYLNIANKRDQRSIKKSKERE